MTDALLYEPVADHVWRLRYRLNENGHVHEPSLQATWSRVALALSGPELHQRDIWCERFRTALSDFRFLPGGRILAGAGSQVGRFIGGRRRRCCCASLRRVVDGPERRPGARGVDPR